MTDSAFPTLEAAIADEHFPEVDLMLNPRKRKYDERIAAETVRTQVGEALRRLADLGFVDLIDQERLRLRPALMRFAEPVRGLQDAHTALERLIARGEALLGEPAVDDEGANDEEPAP
jgi:chromosome partition protein MukE